MSAHTRRNRSLASLSSVVLMALVLAGGAVAAPPEYVPDRVMVRFAPGAAAAARAAARAAVGAQVDVAYTIVPGLERLALAPGRTVDEVVAALQRNPNVLYAEPDFVVHASLTPNDPSYGNLWGMTNIKAPAAWEVTTGNPETVVAIIDTGIDRNHPDLQGNLWTNPGETANGIDDDRNGYVDDLYGWDFAYGDNNPSDVNGHGTHTAGTVGARGNNNVGVVGVNWQVKLVALKFLNDQGSGATSNAVLAVQYAKNKSIRVSNNSWGGGSYSQSLYDAINAAKAVGHLFVAAAGNSNVNTDSSPHYPSSYTLDNIISVASITSSDARSSFSNYGATSVDLGAPGSSILSTVPNNGYSTYSGTSMAAPHVAGAAVLLMGLHPTWTYGEIRGAILGTARPIAALKDITVTGGTLDLAKAVAYTPAPPPSPPAVPSDLTAEVVSKVVTLRWTDQAINETGFYVGRANYDTRKKACGTYSVIKTVGDTAGVGGTTTTTDTRNSGSYCYKVQAYNAGGTSDWSNVVEAVTVNKK